MELPGLAVVTLDQQAVVVGTHQQPQGIAALPGDGLQDCATAAARNTRPSLCYRAQVQRRPVEEAYSLAVTRRFRGDSAERHGSTTTARQRTRVARRSPPLTWLAAFHYWVELMAGLKTYFCGYLGGC
jgi:hypothetical protein